MTSSLVRFGAGAVPFFFWGSLGVFLQNFQKYRAKGVYFA